MILQTFDFSLLDSPDFKEDSVREEIILPKLHKLGYHAGGANQIVRSKRLAHPFVKIGGQRRRISIIPDYLLSVEHKPAWILDAKAPDEEIKTGGHVEQAYSYAIHPDVRVPIFALCNGREFIAFQVDKDQPVLYFHLSEIERHWHQFAQLLSPRAFQRGMPSLRNLVAFDYTNVKPLSEIKVLKKQSAKRHFGVHPYFNKQVWNVVQEYIKNFTQPGDVVLDPFGGSGVTCLEALILGRKAIHIDINPLSIFLTKNLISPINMTHLLRAFDDIKQDFEQHAPQTDSEIEAALVAYRHPKGIELPKGSDVRFIQELFSPKQLAQLAYLKHLIQRVKDDDIRGTLLLMFSGLLNKINLTYHTSSGRSAGGGNSSIFAYYRYRIAKNPATLEIMPYFESRLKKIIAAKQEITPLVNAETLENVQVLKGSATDLNTIADESVDYIYTDPPYGNKIQYLDLSTMWIGWLDLPIRLKDYELEAIEGGKLEKSKVEYSKLLAQSIEEMYRVLKFDRWMSFIFAHKDPAYWHLIIETAQKVGFEYMGAVKQSNNKTTFKKRQNPFTVLSGQLIINFKKVRNPKAIMKVGLGADITEVVVQTVENIIAENDGATLEEINDELILKGLEYGFLDLLSKEYEDITPLLNSDFTFDEATKKFHLRQDTKFQSRIDLRVRIRYFLISYLRRIERERHYPTFDEIIFHIMPLLKDGITPEAQTILTVLQDIADRTGDQQWRLKTGQQLSLL